MIVRASFSSSFIKTTLFLFLLTCFTTVYSKERKWGHDMPLIGQAIQGGQLGFIDPEFSFSTEYVTVSNKSFVELKINDFAAPYYWFTVAVDLQITPILNDGSDGIPYTKRLIVENNHYGNFGNFVDLQKHLIVDGVKGANISVLSFEVLNKETNVLETTIPNNVVLTYTYEVERYYNMDSMAVVSSGVSLSSQNTLDFTWTDLPEAEGYELEWTWIDDYNRLDYTLPLLPQYIRFSVRDFELNNTRIQTTNNTFSIPLVYDRGYIIYRVRPIGRFMQDVQAKYEGDWTTVTINPVFLVDWSPFVYHVTNNHSNINWQFQASYAEDGKKKEVVSYFDGSLRNRQTVTKINTNQKTVVGEVIYDEEGRPAIEVLPAPVESSTLQYFPNFNRNIENKVYSYQDFTIQPTTNCNLSAQGMSTSSGASKYYSDNNAIENDLQDFVPIANKYPFSQIEYSKDNTGRIKKKSGVGVDHKLGSDHEMQYFYSVPAQEELNRLFGYSVGNVAHYKKNIVIDPNLQVSTSYIDPQGRTIATALSGKSPENMRELSNDETGIVSNFNIDLLNKNQFEATDTTLDNNIKYLSSNYWGTQDDGLRYDGQKVFIQAPGDYNFTYRLKENMFAYQCGQTNFTYPFIYYLNFEVNDECGTNQVNYSDIIPGEYNELISDNPNTPTVEQGIKLGKYIVDITPDDPSTEDTDESNVSLVSFNTAKFNDVAQPSISFTVATTKVANYGISKRLTVDQEALEIFANDYIKRGLEEGCILQPQDPDVNLSPCFYTCEQCEKFYDGLDFTFEPGNGEDSVTYPGLTYPNPNQDPNDPNDDLLRGKEAYVQSALDSNLELSELISNPEQYNELKTLLEVRYLREWELIKLECMEPCQESGFSLAGGEVSSMTCDNSLETVMTDMLPNGQYGIYQSDVDSEGNIDGKIGRAHV